MESSEHSIFIVGAGINTPSQLSLEAVDILGSCDEVWTNVPERVYVSLPGKLPSLTRSLRSFFQADRVRGQNYNAITEHLLIRAEACSRLGYLTQGHPLIFDSVAAALLENAPAKRIAISVQPGISSIDTVLTDVRYDPSKGLQVYEATKFVRDDIHVDARGALLLLQPSVFGSRLPRLNSAAPAPDLSPLMNHLKKIYPDEHRILFVRSVSATMPAAIVEATIATMSSVAREVTLACSLFIPPLAGRAQAEKIHGVKE
jgi:uncharacterized protein YabN with tetrapyrrole methylase and pyrophosphatase domain